MSPVVIVETPSFRNQAKGWLAEDELQELLAFLAWNPKAGPVIEGTGGVRKLRWAREGAGKSGGFRVIYYFYNETVPLFALDIYPKSEQANISQADKNLFRKLTAEIVTAYQQGASHAAQQRRRTKRR